MAATRLADNGQRCVLEPLEVAMGRISSKLSYANVVATLALFVALGGGAYAASTFVHATGVVDLCVSHSGAVKVLAAKKSRCGKGTSLVSVNQRGPVGAQGPAGTSAPADLAGSGLTLSGTSLSANLAQVQARIAGSGCTSGQALQSVAQDGTPTCTGLHAYESPATVAGDTSNGVGVPAGTWLLLGQAQAAWNDTGSEDVVCSLQAGSQIADTVNQTVVDGATGTLDPIATVTTTGSSTSVQIACTYNPKLTIGTNLAVVAIPLAALN
jgi:hypothetical protein